MTRAVMPHNIAQLVTEHTASSTAIDSAIAYLSALEAAVQAAYDAAETAGATAGELTDLDTLITDIGTDTAPIITALQDAIP